MKKFHNILSEMSYREFNLKSEFDKINRHAFGGKITPVPLVWKTQKNRLGYVKIGVTRLTRIVNVKFLALSNFYDLTYEQYKDVLAHEMIHVFLAQQGMVYDIGDRSHGVNFNREMRRLNNMGYDINVRNSENISVSKEGAKEKSYGVVLYKMGNELLMTLVAPEKLSILSNILKNKKGWLTAKVSTYKSNFIELAKFSTLRAFHRLKASYIDTELYNNIIRNGTKYDEFEMNKY